jgi:phosphoserine phosphatase
MQDYPRREAAMAAAGPQALRAGVAAAAFFDLDRTLLRGLPPSRSPGPSASVADLAPAAPAGRGLAAPLRRPGREPRGGPARRRRRAAHPGRLPARGPARARGRGHGARCCVRSSTPSRCASSSATANGASGSTSSRRPCRRSSRRLRRISGFDGALGTVCEVRDGPLHRSRPAGAACRGQGRLRACGLPRARASTCWSAPPISDSHTDLPFLEAVGIRSRVNPDSRAWRRIARESVGWPVPVLEFRARAYPHGPVGAFPPAWVRGRRG